MADNEETQKKGVVLVCWPRIPESKRDNSKFIPPTSAASWWNKFLSTIPIRLSAIHVCKGNAGPFLKVILNSLTLLSKGTRIRIKIHTGTSHTDWLYFGWDLDLELELDQGLSCFKKKEKTPYSHTLRFLIFVYKRWQNRNHLQSSWIRYPGGFIALNGFWKY